MESDVNSPGHPSPEQTTATDITEQHKGKAVVGSGSRVKAQHRIPSPSYPTSTSAPEIFPAVEGEEKSALLQTGSGGENAENYKVSEEDKGVGICSAEAQNQKSIDDAFKDQSKQDPCLQTAPKSKIPKRWTPACDVPVTARETPPESFTTEAQKQTCSKESSKSEVKVDKKHRKEKTEDVSAVGKRQDSVKRTPPADKPRKHPIKKVPDQEDSKASLASSNSNIPCLTGKNSNITTLKETNRPKTSPTTEGQQKSPTKETSVQVPNRPKTGKLMITLLFQSRKSHCFGGKIRFVG